MVRGWAWTCALCAVAVVSCGGTSVGREAPDTAGSGGKGGNGRAGGGAMGGSGGAVTTGGAGGVGGTSGKGSVGGTAGNTGGSGGATSNGGAGGSTGGLGGKGAGGGEGGTAGDVTSAGEGGAGGAQACSEDVLVTTRDELVEFAARGCEVLKGSLTIQSPTLVDLSDLAGNAPSWITGSLIVQQNAELTSVEGLAGLAEVSNTLVVMENAKLTNLGGLETMDGVGSMVISGNEALSSVAGLTNAHVNSIVVSNNAVLENVDGLGYLQGANSVTIVNSPALTEVRLPLLEECSACIFSANPALVTLVLNDLMWAGDLSIAAHGALTTVSLPHLYDVARSFTVADNAVLSNIGTLDDLETVGSLSIQGNPALPQCFVDALDARLMACNTSCTGNDPTATCD